MGLAEKLNEYQNKRVFITGHTGFKGVWLSSLLTELGATVAGYSLAPTSKPNHYDLLNAANIHSDIGDIRDLALLKRAILDFAPDIVFHLAAQPLVKPSYEEPVATFETNAMGTVNVLEACRSITSIKAIVCITTDKVYENKEWPWGYREQDALGGYDPYSASKACSELIANSYRQSFFSSAESALLATARAGNVIGGGDWCDYRIIPDIVRAISSKECLTIRNPYSVRPWQHVLDCLLGYLLLGERLLKNETRFAESWNFGPLKNEFLPVKDLVDKARSFWADGFEVEYGEEGQATQHETTLLRLDSSKAVQQLNWRPVLEDEVIFHWTFEWYNAYLENNKLITKQQVNQYLELAAKSIN